MAVYQINIWVCESEGCNNVETTSQETDAYSDPVVVPPSGWDYIEQPDKIPDERLACPFCLKENN